MDIGEVGERACRTGVRGDFSHSRSEVGSGDVCLERFGGVAGVFSRMSVGGGRRGMAGRAW